MFHRPKSEDQEDQNTTVNKSSVRTEQPAAPQEQQVKSEAPQPAPEKPQEEEPKMNSNNPETREAPEMPAGPFQRNPQMQRSMPAGGFAGSYAGTAKTSTYDVHNGEERRLVIGQGITMTGEIESCDTLIVEGTLEAALKGARLVEIAETGTFYGAVEIEEAMIAGRFEGEITVHGRLTIKEGGSVTGSIAYKELEVEAGATIDGKISPLASVAKGAEKPKKSMAPKNDNAGQELPFSSGAAAAAE